MRTEYMLLVKTEDGRAIRADSYAVFFESDQGSADCEAMTALGERLIRDARAIRRLRAMKAA